MSAQATFDEPRSTRRATFLREVAAAGPLPSLGVALGGLALGLFLWYGASTHLHRAAAAAGSSAGLIVAFAAGIALAALAWYAYGHYFARRAGVGLATALRWDALSWALLSVYALGFALPVAIVTPARAAFIAVTLFSLSKLFVASRFVPTVRDVLGTFIVTRVPIIVIAELAAAMIGQRPGTHAITSTNPLLAVWGRWDAVHYLDIARRGYYGTDMAFFPLYPFLIRIVGAWTGNQLIAGLLISNATFFFGLLFFYKLIEHQYNRTIAHRAIFYVSIFPTAVFFSAVYTESLFFALTVASFYYIREHKWLTAGLLGGLAALTRVEGVLLFVPYVMEAFVPSGIGSSLASPAARTRALRIAAGALLIPLGLATYMAILWVLRGDPLYFSHVQAHWNRHLAPPWVSVWHTTHVMLTSKVATTVAGQALELGFTALMIGVLAAGFRRLRASFTAYMALSILIPMSTASLMSMPRFALVLFPMFAILAIWGGKPWVNNLIVAFSLSLLGLFTVLFADWYWVA
jgi:Mannosyltransferase (PIG-V)